MDEKEIRVPKNNRYVDSKKTNAKRKIESAFDDYKALLADKTHPDNQTGAYKNNVVSILNRLLVSADDLDSVNPGEGIFGLIILCLRSNLHLKDEMVKMEVKNRELKNEVERLRKSRQ